MFDNEQIETYRLYLEDLVSVTEAARLRGINESSVRKAIKTKRLKIAKKVGASHLVSKTEVMGMAVIGHRPRKDQVTNFVTLESRS